jgi:hypothetical protein
VLKVFDVDVLGFQIELCCRYFGFFFTSQLLGLFFKKFGKIFFVIIWSLCIQHNIMNAESCFITMLSVVMHCVVMLSVAAPPRLLSFIGKVPKY